MNIIDKPSAGRLVVCTACAIGMVPVHQGIIKSYAKAFRTSGLNIFFNKIASGGLSWRTIIGRLGVEQTKPLVMLGCHHHVPLTGVFSKLCPFPGRVWPGIKLFGELLVFLSGNAFHLHYPFMPSENAVKPPVNEHSELRLMPPFHAALTISFLLCGFVAKVLRILRCERQSSGSKDRCSPGSSAEKS